MNFREFLRLGKATAIVLADSERTEEIHVVEEITGRARFSEVRRLLFQGEEARALLRDRPEICSDQVDYDGLRKLPPDSLGFHYVDHLDRNGLSADSQAASTRLVTDAELAYLIRRFRQTHDVWHTLIGLGTAGHEEVIVHAFSWGQLALPVSKLVVFFGGLKHIVLEARWAALRHALWEAYRHGRQAKPLLPVYWERHWEEPIDQIREELGVLPCTRAFVDH
ncbi:MAG: Coq4 family protein [Myxococcota bacterium]